MPGEKKIIIIAGPNGAGKTTFAREFLPREAGCSYFIEVHRIEGQRVTLKTARSKDPDIVASEKALRRAGRRSLDLGLKPELPSTFRETGRSSI